MRIARFRPGIAGLKDGIGQMVAVDGRDVDFTRAGWTRHLPFAERFTRTALAQDRLYDIDAARWQYLIVFCRFCHSRQHPFLLIQVDASNARTPTGVGIHRRT